MFIRDHVSLRISFSSNSPNTTEARTSPITEARPSPIWNILSQLYFKQTNRYFSVCLSLDDCFMIKSSMNIDCCDCICFLVHCSQSPRAFQKPPMCSCKEEKEPLSGYWSRVKEEEVMFKSSFTALGLEVRDLVEYRFTKLEQTILSSQTQIGVPAYTQTH
ncbi:hypothetical protein HID58_086044, partial [Brassica napus]